MVSIMKSIIIVSNATDELFHSDNVEVKDYNSFETLKGIGQPQEAPNWDGNSVMIQAWQAYATIFTVVFMVVTATASMIAFLSVKERGWRLCNKSIFALTCMVISCSLPRSVELMIKLYDNKHFVTVCKLLFSLGSPGLLSAFMNLVLIILDTTRLSNGYPKYLQLKFVITMYLLFMALMTLDAVLVISNSYEVYTIVVHNSFFALYGYITSFGFFYGANHVSKNLKASRQNSKNKPEDCLPDPMRPRLNMLLRISMASGIIAMCFGHLSVYYDFVALGLIEKISDKSQWDWLLSNSILRGVEAISCFIILLAFMNTSRVSIFRKKRSMFVSQIRQSVKETVIKAESFVLSHTGSRLSRCETTLDVSTLPGFSPATLSQSHLSCRRDTITAVVYPHCNRNSTSV